MTPFFAQRRSALQTRGVPHPNQLLVTLALILAGLITFAWLVLRLRRGIERRRVARRLRRGAQGQARARAFLERRGFEIVAAEQTGTGEVLVDGQSAPYEVRVDYVARRRGRLYGVEVKTGDRATDPLHRPTRRQLLEYSRMLASRWRWAFCWGRWRWPRPPAGGVDGRTKRIETRCILADFELRRR